MSVGFVDSCFSQISLSAHAHRSSVLISGVITGISLDLAECLVGKKGETKYIMYF